MLKKYLAAVFLLCAAALSAQKAPGAEGPAQVKHSGYVSSLAHSPGEHILVPAAFDGTIKVWDTESGKEPKTLSANTGTALRAACPAKIRKKEAVPRVSRVL
jgi:WD40 repeat protein